MTNLDLWNSLEKTDPAHTKAFNRSGFRGTAINGTYIAKKLTETFGPCGKGWKFVLEDEQYIPGHKLQSGDTAVVHVLRGHLDYYSDGNWYSTGSQFGQTTMVGHYSSGPYTDEEAPKKSITDCIAKCAVMLGIGADIHLGFYDDNKYVNSLIEEKAKTAEEAVKGLDIKPQPTKPLGATILQQAVPLPSTETHTVNVSTIIPDTNKALDVDLTDLSLVVKAFETFAPMQGSTEELRAFWSRNKKAIDALKKSPDKGFYQAVEKVFSKRKEELNALR